MHRIPLYMLILLSLLGCSARSTDAKMRTGGRLVFEDDFERKNIGNAWLDTGGGYRIIDGALRIRGARNKPLWLKQKLPRDARVEFTARSESTEVDIKAEFFGDGRSRAEHASYTATSYVVILGGWNNKRSIIARMNEHGDDRVVRDSPKGIPGKTYRFAVARKGEMFRWYLNDELFLDMTDTDPLAGNGHEYFAFNNWESEVFFDDFRVFEL